jgi:hypothetical protein
MHSWITKRKNNRDIETTVIKHMINSNQCTPMQQMKFRTTKIQ